MDRWLPLGRGRSWPVPDPGATAVPTATASGEARPSPPAGPVTGAIR